MSSVAHVKFLNHPPSKSHCKRACICNRLYDTAWAHLSSYAYSLSADHNCNSVECIPRRVFFSRLMFGDEDGDDDDVGTLHSWGNGHFPQNNIDWISFIQLNLWYCDVDVGAFVVLINAWNSINLKQMMVMKFHFPHFHRCKMYIVQQSSWFHKYN